MSDLDQARKEFNVFAARYRGMATMMELSDPSGAKVSALDPTQWELTREACESARRAWDIKYPTLLFHWQALPERWPPISEAFRPRIYLIQWKEIDAREDTERGCCFFM